MKADEPHTPFFLPHPAGGRMRRDPHDLLLRFAAPVPARELPRRLSKAGLSIDRGAGRTGGSADVWARSKRPVDDLAGLARATGARWAAPVHVVTVRGASHRVVPLPDLLLVRVVDAEREDQVRALLEELGGKVDEQRTLAVWGRRRRGRWCVRTDPRKRSAATLASALRERLEPECAGTFGFVPAERTGVELAFEHMPVEVPVAFEPDDTAYTQGAHWNLDRIGLTGPGQTAWDLQPGAEDVTVAVLDARPAPDADVTFEAPVDLGDPALATLSAGDHGNQVVAVLAADVDNALGVTGVAAGARVLPFAFATWSDLELAAGIRAATEAGAHVISISAGFDGWNPAVVDEAIVDAHQAGVLVCAAAQNGDREDGVAYPASNGLVLAVGASDELDQRVAPPAHPWGSNYGHGLSLVAPGVAVPWRADARRVSLTEGTSAATPQVAGVAALVRARNPALGGDDARALLERTAHRGGPGYTDVAGYPSAPWHPDTGHGRLDAFAALEAAPEAKPVDRGYHHTPFGPATLGPIFAIPTDDCRALQRGERPAPVLDVQPSAAEALRSLGEHALGGTITGSHAGPGALAIPPVDLEMLDLFDGTGRPLTVVDGDEGLVLVRTDDVPRQAEVVERVRLCTWILEMVVRDEQEAVLATLTPPPGDPLYPLRGDYGSFEEFAWDVLLHNTQPPWAHQGGFLHSLRHLWG